MSDKTWQRVKFTFKGRLNMVHITPLDDLIEHVMDDADGCVCGPAVEIVTYPGHPDVYHYQHHSLDGRELAQRKRPPEESQR